MASKKNWAVTIVGDCKAAEIQVYGNAPEDAIALYELMFEPICADLRIKHYPALTDKQLAQRSERRFKI